MQVFINPFIYSNLIYFLISGLGKGVGKGNYNHRKRKAEEQISRGSTSDDSSNELQELLPPNK